MANSDCDLYYKIGLGLVSGVGSTIAKSLLEFCGSAEGIFREKRRNLLKIPGVGPIITKALGDKKVKSRIEHELKFIRLNNVNVLFFTDEHFPFRLRHCSDCPVLLFSKGKNNFNKEKIVSIVGTRKPTKYGLHFCEKLVDGLTGMDMLIISGMAYGIDAIAHQKSLENGISTTGVLGHGLNIQYPFQHKQLYREMIEKESLITEFTSQDSFYRQNFARRNRIVAGMSDAVVVVESGIKGGSLITANLANSYNRDVFALPGRYTDKLSLGCNALIKNNKAAIIESADDFLKAMMWEAPMEIKKNRQKELMLSLSGEESKIMDYLNAHEEVRLDQMSADISIPINKLSALLLELEMRGLIAAIPGNRYKLI